LSGSLPPPQIPLLGLTPTAVAVVDILIKINLFLNLMIQ
jgi:hypothetical protein